MAVLCSVDVVGVPTHLNRTTFPRRFKESEIPRLRSASPANRGLEQACILVKLGIGGILTCRGGREEESHARGRESSSRTNLGTCWELSTGTSAEVFRDAFVRIRSGRSRYDQSHVRSMADANENNQCSKFVVVIGSKRFKSSTNEAVPCICLNDIVESPIFKTRQNGLLFYESAALTS
jgi:hypothetical protein